jgi:amino acid transporter
MFNRIRFYLFGPPLPTKQMGEKRLNKIRALAAFSPDALSSIAYANQEIYLGLVVAGAAGLVLSFPIGLAIIGVLTVTAISYYQTIQAYPSGGGSYTVARSNLGTLIGLCAGSALMIDYILTAAVSLTAGVEALASAFPVLWNYRLALSLFLLIVIMVLNLRGLQESGTVMSIPVYLFLFTFIPMILFGLWTLITQGSSHLAAVAPPATQTLGLLLVLHSFAAGCTALTGIEAISNGVTAFKEPASKNAGRTLVVMAFLMGFLFLGSIGLTQALAVVANPEETILSALAHRLLGSDFFYYLIQTSTMLILTVAANTSFAGFPRLAAILAQDGFLPRQFTSIGDRLVFANGIGFLSLMAGLLIIIFRAESHLLIPLFAVGAFLAFTLSQSGMVVHWIRLKGRGWRYKAIANGFGAFATGMTLIVIAVSKFIQGAWITILFIPLLVIMFLQIRAHYKSVGEQLSLHGETPSLQPIRPARVVIPISGVHRGIIDAVNFARSISTDVRGVYVELDPAVTPKVRKTWDRFWPNLPLVVIPSPYRSIVGPLLNYLDQMDAEIDDGQLAAVILPEFVPVHWWQYLLHNQTALLLRQVLLYRRHSKNGQKRAIIDIPYYLKK